ncbi:Triacylglycerol lipase [Forsythia ovata]|uniref:Triacylglycerol lipase n=1 Tax=Forsythia ovata TaxID=205694 RepID=A0ABD1VN78_9LAMI
MEEKKVPSLAELTLPKEELRRLRSTGIGLKKMLKIGKAGISEGIVNGIHERWRHSELLWHLYPISSDMIRPRPLVQQEEPRVPTEKHEPKIKGLFVFGSSLVDNGNNNFIKNTIAKVDYLPYGIDFPFGPSGRFTNGKNVIDLLGDKLGIPNYIPPFNDPSTNGRKIVYGVNYASGGSGILDDTGAFAGNVMSLNAQIRNFEAVTLPDLEVQLRSKSRETLPQFLFVVGSGGNDYSLNYFRKMLVVHPKCTPSLTPWECVK